MARLRLLLVFIHKNARRRRVNNILEWVWVLYGYYKGGGSEAMGRGTPSCS